MLDRGRFVPAIILLAGSALLLRARSQVAVPLERPLNAVLARLDGYEVREQKISEDEQRAAGMTNYVARAYARDTLVAFTTLVSYYDRQTQGKTIHSPKNCLPGAGWEVVDASREGIDVDGQRQIVNRYLLKKGASTALAYYWYQGRGRVTASEYQVKWNLLRDAALLGHTEEALVRIVVPVASDSATESPAAARAADATARDVAGRLMKEVAGVLPS